ncbi:MAG: sigma 54-interacting transcriptional regulator [Deltaproteobacteria bacterium]|nr:sigma 54-interacting transcriptional regulator [Deltaproteobacteria bacterium]
MSEKPSKLHAISASQFLLCLFEHFHEGVLITDQDGTLIYYNRVMAKMDGLEHQQVLGRSIMEIYDLDASQSVTLTALRLARPIINRPHVYRTLDGKLVNSISSAYPIFDNNALVGAVCIVVDYSSLMGNLAQSQARPSDLAKAPEESARALSFDDLIGHNDTMKSAVDMARRAATTPSSVMLIGETGTGKELFARAIHHGGQRAAGPFMAINCAAIPSALLEAILFGTTKGAFTGAVDKAGLFELANGGTLFLDELNSMPLELQPKLLRALQDRKIRRIGASRETPIDVKIVSAVNDSPFRAIEKGFLRADLFYRLGVVMVHLPPIRDRRDDIEPLLNHFIQKFNRRLGYKIRGFSRGALRVLREHSWPGNVRELEHAVEAAMNVIDPAESVIHLEHLQTALPLAKFGETRPEEAERLSGAGVTLPSRPERVSAPYGAADVLEAEEDDEFAEEIARLTAALRRSRGNVARAAKAMGYSPQRLHYRLKKFELSSADYKR